MKKEKGFTLIELVAVIVILALIAVIAAPLTINVINSSKEKSFINSAYGLIDGVKLLSWEQMISDQASEVAVQFKDGNSDNMNFKVGGDMPNSGTIYLNPEGKIELKIWNEKLGKCAEKTINESEVKLTETPKENCKIKVCSKMILGRQMSSDEIACEDQDSNRRYVGLTPNNYVIFNNELWRIIGVFNGQAKIIRKEYYYTSIAWDDKSDGSYVNDWERSSLNILLNDINVETSYINTISSNDPNSYSYIDLEHIWNIGGYDNTFSTTATRSLLYNAERSEYISASMTNHLWTGAIGLMYPTDYAYSTSGDVTTCDDVIVYNWNLEGYKTECVEQSWLYDTKYNQWTLTPRSGTLENSFYVTTEGHIKSSGVGNKTRGVRPVVYLKSNVKIVDGKGTEQEPYILGT